MSAAVLKHEIYTCSCNGHAMVHCEIQHFVPSGLTVPELFATVQSELLAAVCQAALIGDDNVSPRSPLRVGIETDLPNPWLSLVIAKPREFLSDLAGNFDRLQKIVTRLIALNSQYVGQGDSNA